MHGGCQEVLRLGVDAHHAQVVVGDLLAIRVFREGFLYFKFVELQARAHFFLNTIARNTCI